MEIENIKIADLPEELQEIADIIGVEKAVKLCEVFSGISIYFPKLNTITRKSRYRQLLEDFKESKTSEVYKELARKYGYSESHTRAIIRGSMQ